MNRLRYHLAVTGTGQGFVLSTLLSGSTVASGGSAPDAEPESSHTDIAGVIEPGASA